MTSPETAAAGAVGLKRLVRRVVRVEQDWHGEWRIYLLNCYTRLVWLDPREWPLHWWFYIRTNHTGHGQKVHYIRVLGLEYHWSTYPPNVRGER